jgi:hypothetical protein
MGLSKAKNPQNWQNEPRDRQYQAVFCYNHSNLSSSSSDGMEYVNENQDYTFKVKNIGLGSPDAPHWHSKVQKA